MPSSRQKKIGERPKQRRHLARTRRTTRPSSVSSASFTIDSLNRSVSGVAFRAMRHEPVLMPVSCAPRSSHALRKSACRLKSLARAGNRPSRLEAGVLNQAQGDLECRRVVGSQRDATALRAMSSLFRWLADALKGATRARTGITGAMQLRAFRP